MNKKQFWQLLENLDPENSKTQLFNRLELMEADEVKAFQFHFDEEFLRAYNWNLWGAAYLIEGGCSDDGFIDFRYGLISRGQKIFEEALNQPDLLANYLTIGEMISHEEIGYVAAEVYENKFGKPLPQIDFGFNTEPSGEELDFSNEDLFKQKFPRLWNIFGEQ